jgi:hypothetical protein
VLLTAGISTGSACASPEAGSAGADSADVVFTRADIAAWRLDGEHRVSPVLEPAAGMTRAATLVFGEDPPAIEIAGETFREIPIVASAAGFAVGRSEIRGAVELRVRDADLARLSSLRIGFDGPRREPVSEIAGRSEPLLEELAAIGVVPRESWGSRSTTCDPNPEKNRFAIHHSVTNGDDDPVTVVRGIQAYHMDGRGYCDAGYHFGVGLDGTAYELRQLDRLGAHTGMQNTGNIGIVFLGCFDATECGGFGPTTPSEASIQTARRLVRTLANLYSIDVSTDTLKGHREWPGQDTVCPGSVLLDRLVDIRAPYELEDPYEAISFAIEFADAGVDAGPAPPADDGCSVASPSSPLAPFFLLFFVWRRRA